MSQQREKLSKEAHAYTPGLKIKELMTVRKVRILPIPGDVLVEKGGRCRFRHYRSQNNGPRRPTHRRGLEFFRFTAR